MCKIKLTETESIQDGIKHISCIPAPKENGHLYAIKYNRICDYGPCYCTILNAYDFKIIYSEWHKCKYYIIVEYKKGISTFRGRTFFGSFIMWLKYSFINKLIKWLTTIFAWFGGLYSLFKIIAII